VTKNDVTPATHSSCARVFRVVILLSDWGTFSLFIYLKST